MDSIIELPSQSDLPPGKTLKCMECGTRLREGQPHTALQPRAHQTVSLLIVRERLDAEDAPNVSTGYMPLASPLKQDPRYHSGRVLTRPLVQGPDLLWREDRG